MSRSIFQAGMSWRVVDSKWSGIQEAFHGFDAETVAGFGEPELDALTQGHPSNPHRRKLDAIVGNAQRMLELDKVHGSFQGYLRPHDSFDDTVKDLRKQFKFLGEMGCYHFLYVVGEEVPPYEEWSARRG
jgi:3-methyladenine DNA glycosylase Tag